MMTPIAALAVAAKKVGIALSLLQAVCTVESGLENVHNYNDGRSHSWGICQVKTETVSWMGEIGPYHHLTSWTDKDLRDNEKNAFAAAVYIKYQLDRYQGDWCKAVSAYNAGTYSTKNKKYVDKVFRYIPNKNC